MKFKILYKRTIPILSTLVLLNIVLVGIQLLRPKPRINESTLSQIKIGMHENEVIEIIGCPPGDYQSRYKYVCFFTLGKPLYREEEWWTDNDYLVVAFDKQNRVVHKGRMDLSEIPFNPPASGNLFEESWRFICSFF